MQQSACLCAGRHVRKAPGSSRCSSNLLLSPPLPLHQGGPAPALVLARQLVPRARCVLLRGKACFSFLLARGRVVYTGSPAPLAFVPADAAVHAGLVGVHALACGAELGEQRLQAQPVQAARLVGRRGDRACRRRSGAAHLVHQPGGQGWWGSVGQGWAIVPPTCCGAWGRLRACKGWLSYLAACGPSTPPRPCCSPGVLLRCLLLGVDVVPRHSRPAILGLVKPL